MESARPAVEADAELVAELCLLARKDLSGQRGGDWFLRRESVPKRARPDLIAWMAGPDQAVRVGTLDGCVVGYGLARIERLEDGAVLGLVEELYVEPEARSIGLGQALMESLVEWFVAQGCTGMDAPALPGDRVVKSFLESNGFKARLIVLHRSLNG